MFVAYIIPSTLKSSISAPELSPKSKLTSAGASPTVTLQANLTLRSIIPKVTFALRSAVGNRLLYSSSS